MQKDELEHDHRNAEQRHEADAALPEVLVHHVGDDERDGEGDDAGRHYYAVKLNAQQVQRERQVEGRKELARRSLGDDERRQENRRANHKHSLRACEDVERAHGR